MKHQTLCDLHLHLYGCIRHDVFLQHLLLFDDIHWEKYESFYETHYGEPSAARQILEEVRAGSSTAPQAFKEVFVFGDKDAGNFARFSAKFRLLNAGSVVSSALNGVCEWEKLEEETVSFARQILKTQVQEGLGYAEQRLRPGADIPVSVVSRLFGALLKVYHETSGPLTARLAASLPRDDPWPQWEVVKQLVLGSYGESLTGLDFCHIEEGYPPKTLRSFFKAFREFNQTYPHRSLALLYHVGESFNDKSLESAIRWVQEAAEFGAHRLGHAIALGINPDHFGVHSRRESVDERRDQIRYDIKYAEGLKRLQVPIDLEALEREMKHLEDAPADQMIAIEYDLNDLEYVRRRQSFAMERVRQTGVVIEVCPTSNRRIGGVINAAHHPVHRFYSERLPFIVASDDPGIFGVTLQDEIDWVVDQLKLDQEERELLIQRAWDSQSELLSGRAHHTPHHN